MADDETLFLYKRIKKGLRAEGLRLAWTKYVVDARAMPRLRWTFRAGVRVEAAVVGCIFASLRYPGSVYDLVVLQHRGEVSVSVRVPPGLLRIGNDEHHARCVGLYCTSYESTDPFLAEAVRKALGVIPIYDNRCLNPVPVVAKARVPPGERLTKAYLQSVAVEHLSDYRVGRLWAEKRYTEEVVTYEIKAYVSHLFW